MANLSNINNILRTSSAGVGINCDAEFSLDIEKASANAILSLNSSGGSGAEYLLYSGTSGEFVLNKRYVGDRLTISSGGDATFSGNVISLDTFYLQNGSGNRWQMLFDTNAFNLRYYNGSSWSADALAIDTSNNATFAGDISIPVAKKLYFGGGSHTYIGEDIDDRLRFFTGGTEFMRFTEDTSDTINFYTDATFSETVTVSNDLTIDNSSPEMYFKTGASHYNWMIAAQENVNTALEFTPANAVGSSGTYNTPALTLYANRNAVFASEITSGDDINSGGKVVVNNVGADKKIAFRRTSSKNWSIEHDSASIYFYNETDAHDVLLMKNAGQIMLGEYGSGTFTGTTAYTLAVDSNGNIIETTDGGGDITGSGTANTVAKFTGAKVIGDGPITFATNDSTFAGVVKALNYFSAESTGGAYIRFKHGTGGLNYVGSSESLSSGFGDENDMLNYSVSGKWGVYTNSAFGMVIDESQNVGIGTTAPQTTLEVDGASSAFNAHFGQGTDNQSGVFGGISLGYAEANTSYRKVGIVAKALADGAARQNLHFLVDIVSDSGSAGLADTKMMIDGLNGYVGIGNQAPQTPLHVTGGLGETMRVQGSSATGKNYINFADSAGNIDAYIGLGSSTTDKFLIVNFTDEPTQFYQKNGIKVTITNVGKVGIGTTLPDTLLNLEGAADASIITLGCTKNDASWSGERIGGINFYSADGSGPGASVRGSINYIATSTSGGSTAMTFKVGDNSEAVRISNDGNVGIGETNPTGYRLIVKNTAEDMVKLHNSTDGLDSLISFTNPGGTLGRIQGLDNGGLQFDTGNNAGGLNTNVIYMSNDGRVGINTDSPDEKLDITGGYLKFNGGDYGLKGSASLSYNATSDHYFQSGGSTTVIFKASGNVGIGNTGPQTNLHVGPIQTISSDHTSGFGSSRFFIVNGNNGGSGVFQQGTSAANIIMFGKDTANTAIGFYNSDISTNQSTVGSITTTASATAFNTSSDYRLKQDLKDFNGLNLLSKIKVYDFEWKINNSRSYGVIAHELNKIIPQAVSGEKDAKEMQVVDYSKLVPVLLKSIQELKQEIEILKTKI